MSTICIIQSQRKTGSPNLLISGSSISRYSHKPDAEDHEDFCRVKIMLHHSHLELNDLRDIDGETVCVCVFLFNVRVRVACKAT